MECDSGFKKDEANWLKGDRVAQGRITRMLSENVIRRILTCNTAKEIWDKLASIFDSNSSKAKEQASRSLYAFAMKPEENLDQLVIRFEELVSRLEALELAPEEPLLVGRLLDALPESFEPLVQSWSSRLESDKTVEELKQVLKGEHERKQHKKLIEVERGTQALFASRGRHKQENPGSNPSGSNSQNNSFRGEQGSASRKSVAPGSKECFYCGKVGHWKAQCRKLQEKLKNRVSPSDSNNQSNINSFISEFPGNNEILLMEEEDSSWVIDTGCTQHMTNNKSWLQGYKELERPIPVYTGDARGPMQAVGSGDFYFKALVNGRQKESRLVRVLYVPNLRRNLFSVQQADKKGCEFRASNGKCQVIRDGKVVLEGNRVGNLYSLSVFVEEEELSNHNMQVKSIPGSSKVKPKENQGQSLGQVGQLSSSGGVVPKGLSVTKKRGAVACFLTERLTSRKGNSFREGAGGGKARSVAESRIKGGGMPSSPWQQQHCRKSRIKQPNLEKASRGINNSGNCRPNYS